VGHPATFPVKLAEQCIRLHGVREDLKVVDQFGGVESTACAVRRLVFKDTLFEIDEAYVWTSRTRLHGVSDRRQMKLL
jgi:site-specific DNA-methyltransferase (adenine-specific)